MSNHADAHYCVREPRPWREPRCGTAWSPGANPGAQIEIQARADSRAPAALKACRSSSTLRRSAIRGKLLPTDVRRAAVVWLLAQPAATRTRPVCENGDWMIFAGDLPVFLVRSATCRRSFRRRLKRSRRCSTSHKRRSEYRRSRREPNNSSADPYAGRPPKPPPRRARPGTRTALHPGQPRLLHDHRANARTVRVGCSAVLSAALRPGETIFYCRAAVAAAAILRSMPANIQEWRGKSPYQ